MPRVAYVNGRYAPFEGAMVHIEDRGYQFADGIYEVIAFKNWTLIDEGGHLDRFERSLAELSIARPMTRRSLQLVMREMIRRNRLAEGILYIQVTRGVARRDHPFPHAVPPSLVMTVRRARPPSPAVIARGVGVVTMPDIRWARCDIKSIALLPNILCKQAAKEAGAFEAWMIDHDGYVTEGASTNAWIVTKDGDIVTRNANNAILSGITRRVVLDGAQKAGLKVVERPFTVAEALSASEAFLTSTTSYVLPVVSIDGKPVGSGVPGKISLILRQAYEAAAQAQTGSTGVPPESVLDKAGRTPALPA